MNLKRFFITVLICSLYLAANFALAEPSQTIAVVTVDAKTPGSMGSIYSNTINLVSSDITNRINMSKKARALDDAYIKKTIKYADLDYDFKTTLTEYKTDYSVNYDRLEKIAKALNADKIIFVTGGFDVTQYLLKANHPILSALELSTDAAMIKPSYKVQVFVSMIDPYQKIVLWSESYEKYVNARNFDYPSSDFAENIVPIAEVKKFSNDISQKVATKAVFFNAVNTTVTNEQPEDGTSTMIDIKKGENFIDSVTSQEQDSYSTQTTPQSLRQRKINDYKNWMENRF